MRLWLAIRAFFKILIDRAAAEAVERAVMDPQQLSQQAALPDSKESASTSKPRDKAPRRNDAITLLEALQREARFLDIVQEPLDGYSDEQVGAAARDVLRDCRGVLERLFGLEPVTEQEEGASVEVPTDYNTSRYKLTGNVSGEPPYQGRLVHPGWQASRCDLPQWLGDESAANIVAPIELEIS